ncbi:PTS transporter subunit EIIC [Spiroplasma endosymbiont of 'Nebria riversi']|uniref:PTS transporter subunit EIIC n=1 Tax=Spiroplasma endosymbiont of 'Nebria riversi' TaxID=2792084 RepID=UPI001C047F58|nr:PTS transporter subunit EIIC [Spiroplasma endosymbiont of 'Nebria riversi']
MEFKHIFSNFKKLKLTSNNFQLKNTLKHFRNKTGSGLQKLAKSLMFPIAILPIAAILSRVGGLMMTKDFGITENGVIWYIGSVLQVIGASVFDNLSVLFAIGVAFGFAKDNRGEAALIGFFAYTILIGLMAILPKIVYSTILLDVNLENKSKLLYQLKGNEVIYSIDMGILSGIIAGILAATCYNRFQSIKLPTALSFFSGRRFVPLVVILVSLPVAIFVAIIWPWLQLGLLSFGQTIIPEKVDNSTRHIQWGVASVYTMFNRALNPSGLMRVLNIYFFWQHPYTTSQNGTVINGDIPAFLSNDLVVGAGLFQSGFFPIMMFGLPAAALAIIKCAHPDQRKKVMALLLGAASISFLTGVTEPLEFSFIYAAPVLFFVHIVLSGIISAITVGLGIRIGFGFSAGAIDYILSFYQSMKIAKITWESGFAQVLANPAWILPIGIISGGAYYFSFSYLIKKFNYQTLGREENVSEINNLDNSLPLSSYQLLAREILDILGKDNIISADNCITRLRIVVKNVDAGKIEQLNKVRFKVRKIVNKLNPKMISDKDMQLVVGNDAQFIADELKKMLQSSEVLLATNF